MRNDQVIVGQDVKRLRSALGMSQQQLATMLGLSTVTVSRWEGDHSVPRGYGAIAVGMLLRLVRRIPKDQIREDLSVAATKEEVVVTLVRLLDQASV